MGAIGGGLYGGVKQPMSDWWYNKVQGPMTQARAQAGDFNQIAGQMGKVLQEVGVPEYASKIMQIAQAFQADVEQMYQQSYQNIRSEHGLAPAEASMWERFKSGIANPLDWAKSKWQTLRAQDGRLHMIREAISPPSNIGGEVAGMGIGLAGEVGTATALGSGSIAGAGALSLIPAVGYMVGEGATSWGYDQISNMIRGKMGQLNNMAQNLGRIATEIARATGNQRFMQYAASIHQILSAVQPQLAAKMSRGVSMQSSR